MARVVVVKIGQIGVQGPQGPPGAGSDIGGIDTPQLATGAVTPAKTAFLTPGTNLYDVDASTAGYYLSTVNGTLFPNADYRTSDYIPVTAGQPYTISSCRYVVLYDTGQAFVSGSSPSQSTPTTITPAVDGYLRFSYSTVTAVNPTRIQMEAGSSATTYVPYTVAMAPLALTEDQIAAVTATLDQVVTEPEATRTLPDATRTLSVVGDLHVGYTGRADAEARLDSAFDDLATLTGLHAHRLYAGDQVDEPGTGAVGTTPGANDTAFLARANALDPDRDRWDAAIGNHDQGSRQADNWAAVYGYADQNWVRDLGFVRIVSVGADNTTDYPDQHQTLSAATMAWLAARLAENGTDTIILSHGPLAWTSGTVAPGGTTVGGISTANKAMRTAPETDLYTLLDQHPHVRAWVCGHTHVPYEAVGAITKQWLGSRHIAHINAGAINWTNTAVASADDPVRSLFVTLLADGIEVRIRNHDDQAWEALYGDYPYVLPAATTHPAANPTAFVFPLNGSLAGETTLGDLTVTTVGSPAFTTVGGEQALNLDAGTKAATLNASALLLPGEGSLIVRCAFGPYAGSAQMAINQAASGGLDRIFVQRTSTGVLTATVGGVDSGGAPFAWSSDPRLVADGEVVTIGLDWHDGEAMLRINGDVAGRGGYSGLTTIRSLLSFGRSSSATSILGPLFGMAGFTRVLTSQEHDRFVAALSDTWTMQTVLGG